MPVHKVTTGSRTGYQWGKTGTVYYGSGAKQKAQAQGRAAYASGYRGSTNGSKKRK